MNNLAELITINIDTQELQSNWIEQKKQLQNHIWEWRNEFDLSDFNPFFQNLLKDIVSIISIKPKNFLIQIHDKEFSKDKFALTYTHTDCDRATCVTIPIVFDKVEKVRFYNSCIDLPARGSPIKSPPIQVWSYSNLHPTLVNVSNPHNVFVIGSDTPRILLQLSYDESFEEIIDANKAIWKIL